MYRGYIYLPNSGFIPAVRAEVEDSGVYIEELIKKNLGNKSWYTVYLRATTRKHYQFLMYRLFKKFGEAGTLKDFKQFNICRKGILK